MAEAAGLGSKNPFILRNYRYIYPAAGKEATIDTSPQQLDNNFQFKIDGAPVILTYESDVVLRFTLTPSTQMKSNVDIARRLLSGETTTFPPYRLKMKSLGTAVKYCRVNLSNYSFYTLNTPMFLTEGIYRKTPRFVESHPDSYTTEACVPLEGATTNGAATQRSGPLTYALAPAGTITKGWDNTSFVTPLVDPQGNYVIDFRIPFTDLLPFFRSGVIPMLMINSQSFDMMMTIHNPLKWFVPTIFANPASFEIFLSLTTVALPEMNPLAELLIKPHLGEKLFRAPYLDYYIFDQVIGFSPTFDATTWTANNQHSAQRFNFNILQYFRNVPFISLSFMDLTSAGITNGYATGTDVTLGTNTAEPYAAGMQVALSVADREAAGFYTLPPGGVLNDVNVRLGPSSFPITQWAMDNNMTYLMNRKHFEMYGRRYNNTRISPLARMQQGDATVFFDLSHGPFGGFQIDSDNPLQVTGEVDLSNSFFTTNLNLRVILTIWYSNHFVIDVDSGAVVTEQ